MSPRNDPLQPSTEHPFRKAVLRGLGVVVPPLLTIVIFLWVAGTVNQFVLRPFASGVRYALVWHFEDEIQEEVPADRVAAKLKPGVDPTQYYYETPDRKFVPYAVYDLVRKNQGAEPLPETAKGVYRRYVELRYLKPHVVVPTFLAIFILVLYLLGKFMAAGIGRIFVGAFERGILQLPLVRNVYSSVKQVTDFLFSPRQIEYTRVVAIEYPRAGIWSLGLVTGESMLDIRAAANEPVLSILVPTSPMPVTGYTINVRKSEALDLNITIDQAFQFIVSCGVVVPPQQLQEALEEKAEAEQIESDAGQAAAGENGVAGP
ncbi:MAG: DUF502 domain-containing protein [Pirellulales bacterium]|nr:DUF502 domain-containing protein [Pirellulales bacterium]